MGLQLQKQNISEAFFRNRETGNALKEKVLNYIFRIINEENQVDPTPSSSTPELTADIQGTVAQYGNQPYKCFVGKGNNSFMIRTLFKTRYWWLLHDKEELDKVNFMWTQLRKNSIMDQLPCNLEEAEGQFPSHTKLTSLSTPQNSASKKKKKMASQASFDSGSMERQLKEAAKGVAADGQTPYSVKLYNKLEDNFHLSNKKALFLNMKNYYDAMGKDVFAAVPVTFHIKEGLDDPQFARFKSYYF